jgi:uncharacterized membrane protein YhaH (DUF805 family)
MIGNPFSFKGRIRRIEYAISFILFSGLFLLNITTEHFILGKEMGGIILIPLYWLIYAQGAKRSHDIGNSGWYQIIPLYNLFILFAEPDSGPNKYGLNPRGVIKEKQKFKKVEQARKVKHEEGFDKSITASEDQINDSLLEQINDLNRLIIKQKQVFHGIDIESKIKTLTVRLNTSQDASIKLLHIYYQEYGTDLISDLKSLTTSFNGKKSYVQPFIEFNIIEDSYPHNYLIETNI